MSLKRAGLFPLWFDFWMKQTPGSCSPHGGSSHSWTAGLWSPGGVLLGSCPGDPLLHSPALWMTSLGSWMLGQNLPKPALNVEKNIGMALLLAP